MAYLQKPLTPEVIDELRVNLSVRDDKLSEEPVCDFCGGTHPVCVYAAKRLSTGEVRECWRWLACNTCKDLVDHCQFIQLQSRMTKRFISLFNVGGKRVKPLVAQAIRISFDSFLNDAVRVNDAD